MAQTEPFDMQIAPFIILKITNPAQISSGITERITCILRVVSLSKMEGAVRHLGVNLGHRKFSYECANLRGTYMSYRYSDCR